MDIEGLFHSPENHIAAFAKMQVLLYQHDPSLQDYFMQIQLDALTGPRANSGSLRMLSQIASWAIQSADKASQIRRHRKKKADVLFCPMPYFGRKTENRFFVSALLGVAQTDAKILCLLPGTSPCRAEIDAELKAAGRNGQVEFIDPTEYANQVEARFRARILRRRADLALEKTVSILEPYGWSPSRDLKSRFEHLAYFVEAWERLAPDVEFDAVVARCHWHALCSPVCRTALQRGKPVVTFQQGVIGHTLDVPVTASKYVAFGRSSSSFLARANQRFFQAARVPVPPVEYVNGGSLIDDLTPLPDQFANRTLLIVDVPTSQSDFYGVQGQCKALLQLAERLLVADLPLQRIVIRPHPFWSDLDYEACKQLVREHSTRCELSHPSWSLDDDLRRCSAVVGIYSGVLTVASACGLPSVFLQTENGYTTGDLACFAPDQTLQTDAAFDEISRILTDRAGYAQARAIALRNAREYYEDAKNADLSGGFFEPLLQGEPTRPKPTVTSAREA